MDDSQYDYDLEPLSFLTVGTQGPPGQRTFYLQAAQGAQVVSLEFEKQQAMALAVGLRRLLANIEDEAPGAISKREASRGNLALLQPVTPVFRIGSLGIGVDEAQERVLLVVRAFGPEDEPAQTARFVASIEQVLALVEHIPAVVEKGRPECPACGEPMDPEGHRCPRRNGHAHVEPEAG